ncbi:hypothetical protein EDD95_5264 [Streptomyces sp. CEV 2-1]|nr:hypothetical protein EDD95_5264 [Streptomyces sp. CEV 2-1]
MTRNASRPWVSPHVLTEGCAWPSVARRGQRTLRVFVFAQRCRWRLRSARPSKRALAGPPLVVRVRVPPERPMSSASPRRPRMGNVPPLHPRETRDQMTRTVDAVGQETTGRWHRAATRMEIDVYGAAPEAAKRVAAVCPAVRVAMRVGDAWGVGRSMSADPGLIWIVRSEEGWHVGSSLEPGVRTSPVAWDLLVDEIKRFVHSVRAGVVALGIDPAFIPGPGDRFQHDRPRGE